MKVFSLLFIISCRTSMPSTEIIPDKPDDNKNEEKITIPDDLSSIATPLAKGGSFSDGISFIYKGNNKIQGDIKEGAIEGDLFHVMGFVVNSDGGNIIYLDQNNIITRVKSLYDDNYNVNNNNIQLVNNKLILIKKPQFDNNQGFSVVDDYPGVSSEDGSQFYYFDEEGKHIKTVDSLTGIELIKFGYNENGYLTTITDKNNNITTIERDSDDYATKIIAPFGQVTTLDIDKTTGYLNSLSLPMNRTYQMTYDTGEKEGLLKTFTKPNGGTNTFTYDELGLLIKDTDAENGFKEIIQTGVEGSGKIEVKSAMGRVTTYETTIAPQPPEGGVDTQVKIINYVYDTEKDQLTSVNLDNSTLSYEVLVSVVNPEIYPKLAELQYDGGLLLSENSSTYNSKLEWVYDDDLRVKSIKLTTNGDISSASMSDYLYNDDNQLISAGDMAYSYDNNGFLSQTRMLSGAETPFSETYDYNDYGEVVSVNNGKHDFSYTYDGVGRIKTINNIEYFYDMQGRIEKVIKDNGLQPIEEYTYDANGNRLTANFDYAQSPVAATYDAQDRMLTYGQNSYTYTKNGALLTKTNTEGTTEYSYDAMGNLLRVKLPDNRVVTYQIDARGRRIGKSIDGVFQYGFVYGDQLNPIVKVDESGDIIESYIYGLKSNVPEYIEKNGVKYKIISDHLGSPLAVWQEGVFDTPVLSRKYDSFGNILEESGSFELIFGFAGGIWDVDTGLVRFGVRDYDGETGRWTSKEPLGFAGSRNFYVYAGNDGVNWIDLDGREKKIYYDKDGSMWRNGLGRSGFDNLIKLGIDFLQMIICDSINDAKEYSSTIENYTGRNKRYQKLFPDMKVEIGAKTSVTLDASGISVLSLHTHIIDGKVNGVCYNSESFSSDILADKTSAFRNDMPSMIGTINGNVYLYFPLNLFDGYVMDLGKQLDLSDCICPLTNKHQNKGQSCK